MDSDQIIAVGIVASGTVAFHYALATQSTISTTVLSVIAIFCWGGGIFLYWLALLQQKRENENDEIDRNPSIEYAHK